MGCQGSGKTRQSAGPYREEARPEAEPEALRKSCKLQLFLVHVLLFNSFSNSIERGQRERGRGGERERTSDSIVGREGGREGGRADRYRLLSPPLEL